MIKVAQQKQNRTSLSHLHTKKTTFNDSNYKQAKNNTLSNNAKLHVNSNQYTSKPHSKSRTYICMFSHKQMYTQINLLSYVWLYLSPYLHMYVQIQTPIPLCAGKKSNICGM